MKRNYRIISIVFVLAVLILCISGCAASDESKYKNAQSLLGKGQYSEAAEIFDALGSYEDSTRLSMYAKAVLAGESGDYETAFSAFRSLEDLKDSKQLLTYYEGRRLQASADSLIDSESRDDLVMAKNDYDEATQVYSGLALFKDCQTRLSACQSGSDNAQEKIHAYDYAAADKLEQDGKYEEAIEAFRALGSYSNSAERIKGAQEKIYARDYAAADQLEQDGKYEEAIKAFEALGSYSDSADRIKGAQEKIYARDYAAADQLEQDGKYEEAIRAFEALGSYSDSADRIKGAQEKIYARDYAAADKLEQDGKYEEAIEAFKALGSYNDSAERAARIAFEIVGNIVVFGSYEQDNNISNGVEPIEWIVLDVQDKKALLISRYALDTHAYHTDWTDVTWETCELRSWLNGSFISTAFSATEQSAILMTTVDNSDRQGNSKWNTNGGNDTNDKLFLLSYAEAGAYFSNDDDRMCAPTDYAIAQGAMLSDRYKTDGRATGLWWLRSPGYYQYGATHVSRDGSRDSYRVNYDCVCVRPAFWLNLESEIF